MIFKYELRFVAFTWPNFCSLDLSIYFSLCLWIVIFGLET